MSSGMPPPPPPKALPAAPATSNFQRNLALFGAYAANADTSSSSSSDGDFGQHYTATTRFDEKPIQNVEPQMSRPPAFRDPEYATHTEDTSARRPSFSDHRRYSGGPLALNHSSIFNTNGSASFISASSPLTGGAHNEVNALRNKVSELEYMLSKMQISAGDIEQQKIDLDTIRLERDVAKRNCDILTSNVDTLKALSLSIATELEQSVTRCRTLEERLVSVNLKKELSTFEGADSMRRDYETRIVVLKKTVKDLIATSEATAARFAEREVEQDERVRALEISKDETILRLQKENEALRQVLRTGTSADSHRTAAPLGRATANISSSAAIKNSLRQHRLERHGAAI